MAVPTWWSSGHAAVLSVVLVCDITVTHGGRATAARDLVAPVTGIARQVPADTLPAYELDDQFGQRHVRPAPGGRRQVFLIGDRAGGPVCTSLAMRLTGTARSASPSTRVMSVAALRGVPFFVKPSIRQSLRSERTDPVLLDWNGVFTSGLGYQAGSCLVIVSTEAGRITARTALRGTSEADQARADTVVARALALSRT